MGGPYKFYSWKTGQESCCNVTHYWGLGKEGIDQAYIDQRTLRVTTLTRL